jgi:hypothetical protein
LPCADAQPRRTGKLTLSIAATERCDRGPLVLRTTFISRGAASCETTFMAYNWPPLPIVIPWPQSCDHALLLPAPSQGLVPLDNSQQFIGPSLHEAKLRREGVGFVGQDFQIARDTTVVAHVGNTRRILGGSEKQFLLSAKFPRPSSPFARNEIRSCGLRCAAILSPKIKFPSGGKVQLFGTRCISRERLRLGLADVTDSSSGTSAGTVL